MRSKAWYIIFCRPTPRTVIHEVYEDKERAVKRFMALCDKGFKSSGVDLEQRWLTRADIKEKLKAGIKIIATRFEEFIESAKGIQEKLEVNPDSEDAVTECMDLVAELAKEEAG